MAQKFRPTTPASTAPTLTVESGSAYEVLLGLGMIVGDEEESSYSVGAGWFREARARQSPQLKSALKRLTGGRGSATTHLIGLVHRPGSGLDVQSLLAYLERIDPRELKLTYIGYHWQSHRHGTPRDLIAAMAAGDAQARRRFDELSDERGAKTWKAITHRLLGIDDGEFKELTITAVQLWYEQVFRGWGDEVMDWLERDAAATRRLAPTLPIDRLITQVTRGITWDPHPETCEVVLVPSAISRPWVTISEHDEAIIFCYPATNRDATAAAEAPQATAATIYRALGDESRLRLLQSVASGVESLTELAERVGLAKSTVHAHLMVLRNAGLLQVGAGQSKGYRLAPELPDVAGLLASALGSPRAGTSEGTNLGGDT